MQTPELPDGWRLDPDVEQIPGASYVWVILPDGTRTAWQMDGHPCPVCDGILDKMPDCNECVGRGQVDSIPYCDRPWDLIWPHPGELWLGGIHCQFGGVAEGPGGIAPSVSGNAFPEDRFDVVLSLTDQPGYEPSEGTEFHVYRIADADLDPKHHTKLDYLAERVETDVQSGKKVLVRCQAGINRSALVSGLALLRMGLTVDQALEQMREARSPYVLCNRSFVAYLREVEARRG